MRISLGLLALGSVLVAIGCAGSHGRDDDGGPDGSARCSGTAPYCPRIRAEGGPGCCDGVGSPAECAADGAWHCPSGTVELPACSGFWEDDRCGMEVPECDGPSQCVLRPASCCGRCGAPTPDDLIAIPVASEAEYVSRVCEGGAIGCPECASPWDPYLVATCRAERCVAVDLHVDPVTECTAPSDCALTPIQCCACGLLGPEQVVAYNPARGSLGSLLCDPDVDCPPCVPDFGGTSATCEAGRCVVIAPSG